MANLTLCKNPFRPQIDREEVFVRAGTRLDTVLRNQGLISGRGKTLHRRHTFVVMLNGKWLMQEQWARRVRSEDSIGVLFVPGKGGGGSNPMQIVAMVALAAATAGVGAWAAGAYAAAAGVAATSTAAIVVGAGVASLVAIGGGMLVSALFPPAKPPSVMAREQASPTYTIGAQGNTARLMESIPVQYGRFRAYPDFAAQPYTELAGNETYLYQLFCLGQGEYDIEEIRIEDTPISNFAEVQYEVVPPSGNVTLFPDNVVTSTAVQGLELKGANEDGHAAIGPFVANPAGTTTTKLAVDIVLPAGLFYANDRGGLDARSVSWSVLAHPINDAGESTGPAITLGTETFSAGTNTPQMMTYRYDVPEGRYSVSAVRTSAKDTSSRAGNTLQWGGLRAYLPDHRDYGDVTLIAVVIRATNNLNQSTARRVNVISTRKLQTWHPANGWSFGVSATRNPAWALADVCRNQEYGRGLPDSRINLQALYRLSRIWDERGDSCDGRFDTATTLWDALTQIARTGRAMPMYYAGIIDFIRNEPKSVKTLMFTPNNIISNSFSVDYVFPQHDSPDYIIVEFFNEDTWQPDEVECALPGSAKQRPYRLQMPMVANRAQAWREGMSLAAQHRDQRRFVSFQTEMEGHIPRYGDLVEISHDVPAWGLSGFIESYDPSAKLLIATEPLSWWKGENHYINLRKRDGSPDGPYRVVAGAHEREMIIADAIDGYDVYVSNGQGEDFTHYQFGPGERRSLLAQVISTQPDESGNVSIDLVNYAPSVHSAENGGAVPPPGPSSLLPSMPNAPVIDSVIVYPTAITGQQIISATPARGAVHYEFRASDNDGQTWLDLGLHERPSITVNLAVRTWRVQVRGIGVMHGPWANWVGPVSATMAPPPVLTHLSTKPLHWGLQLNWVWPSGINLTHIEVWISQTPHFLDAALLGLFPYPQTKHELGSLSLTSRLWFWARVRDEANQAGLWFPSESGAGVLGHPINDATEYNELVNQSIIANGLGSLIMGNIHDIPNIRDNVAEISIDLSALDGRVAEINAQVNELLGAAEWDATKSYALGTVVFHNGKMYRAKKAVPAGTPVSNTAHWDLIGDYASISDGLIALAIQAQETLNRVEQAEGQISAVSAKTDTLATKVNDPENGLTALSLSVHQLRTQVTQLQDGLTALSEATTQLSSKVEGLEGAQDALSNAVQQLSTRVEQTEAGQSAIASDVTQLKTSVTTAQNTANSAQTSANAAQTAAQAASDKAGGKGEVIYSSTAPVVAKRLAQNLWIDTTGNANTPKRWNGAAWVAVTDKVATDAVAAAAQAKTAADAAKAAADLAQQTANQKADASALTATNARVTAAEGKLTSAGESITRLDSSIANLAGAAGNLLKNSNREIVRGAGIYKIGEYRADKALEVGKTYTLVACITHEPAAGDTVSSVGAWAGNGMQSISLNLVKNAARQIVVRKFVRNSQNPTVPSIEFYYYPNTVKTGAATIHWACLYDGDVVPPLEWQPSDAETAAAIAANATAVDGLTNRVTSAENGLTAAGQRSTVIEARIAADQDSDSLIPDYLMANPDSWYSHYGTDLSPRFVMTETGKIAPTVFRHTTGTSFNYSRTAIPTGTRYRVRFWARRSTDSNGSMHITMKNVRPNGSSGATDYTAVDVRSSVPADEQWHLVDRVVQPSDATFSRVQFGFSANHTATAGWVEIQGYRVTAVIGTADINTSEVATAQSVSSLSSTVSQQGSQVISQGQAITALQGTVNHPTRGVAATADAVNSINIWAGLVDNKLVAQAQSIQSLTADIGTTQASVQTVSQAQNELDGRISASYAVKTAVNVNGVRYVSGFGLDTTTEGGVTQTTFAVVANRFVVMHDINGVPTAVFSVQGGASILNAALIGQASITEAKIANGSITRAKIANAAIGNAQIENGAITSAKIGDAQITTAKIGNAQVDTLRIANNSVGITAFTEAGSAMLNQSYRDISVGLSLPYPATVIVSASIEGFPSGSEPTAFVTHYILQDSVFKKSFTTNAGYSPTSSSGSSGYVGHWVSGTSVSYVFQVGADWAGFMLRQYATTSPWGGNRHYPPANIRIDAFMK